VLLVTNRVKDLLTVMQMVDNVTVLYVSVDTKYEWENYISQI